MADVAMPMQGASPAAELASKAAQPRRTPLQPISANQNPVQSLASAIGKAFGLSNTPGAAAGKEQQAADHGTGGTGDDKAAKVRAPLAQDGGLPAAWLSVRVLRPHRHRRRQKRGSSTTWNPTRRESLLAVEQSKPHVRPTATPASGNAARGGDCTKSENRAIHHDSSK